MAESFAASEDLGFVALSLPTGGSIWLAAASIYALETHPQEDFTTVKTVGETLGVTETPEVVFNSIEAIQRNSANREKRRSVVEFVDFVSENGIKVYGEEDKDIQLYESDDRMKEVRSRGLAANDRGADRLQASPVEFLNDDQFADSLRAAGVQEVHVQQILGQRQETRFDQEAEEEFGDDLGSVMEQMRRREQEGDSDRG